MNVLAKEQKIRILKALVEGCSIRSIERMYGNHRDTIMRLLVEAGKQSGKVMHQLMRDIPAGCYQVDELWTYVGKKAVTGCLSLITHMLVIFQAMWLGSVPRAQCYLATLARKL